MQYDTDDNFRTAPLCRFPRAGAGPDAGVRLHFIRKETLV